MTEAAPPVLRPTTEADLAELVRWAAAEALPLELVAGGSKPGFGRPVQSAHRLDLSALAGRPVRFRFSPQRGELYAFWVSASPAGASRGFVAAGGPGFTGTADL